MTPVACSANPVLLPTSPPPPMMEAFIDTAFRSLLAERRHHLVGDRRHERFQVAFAVLRMAVRRAVAALRKAAATVRRRGRGESTMLRCVIGIAFAEEAVAAQVAVFH